MKLILLAMLFTLGAVLIGCVAPKRKVAPLPMPPAIQFSAKSARSQMPVTNNVVLTFTLQSTTDGRRWTVVTNWVYRVNPVKSMELFRLETTQ